jgi:hypothetical protein
VSAREHRCPPIRCKVDAIAEGMPDIRIAPKDEEAVVALLADLVADILARDAGDELDAREARP